MREVAVVTDSFPLPGMDTGVSHAVARAVGRGELGETLRLHPASPIVAFGRQDVVTPGYTAAVRVCREQGFEAVERLAGGRAAVFHQGTLAFSWAIPTEDPREGIYDRFEALARVMQEAITDLGASDVRVGEVPGEYCPGQYSVNLGGRWKVMGVGQRLVRGAAHVGGVVVVRGGDRIRDVLRPVYRALGVEWDPATAGDLEAAIPGVTVDNAASAILTAFRRRYRLAPARLPSAVVEEGRHLADRHLSPADTATSGAGAGS